MLLVALALIAWLWRQERRATESLRHALRERSQAIEARNAYQADLVRAQAQLAGLGAADADASLLLDADRRIVWGNVVAWEMFGGVVSGQRSAVSGREAAEPVIRSSFIALVGDAELHQAVLDAVEGSRLIVRQVAVNGRTLQVRAIPLASAAGVAVSIEDVTEQQRLGRARRDLVANISHELRTPLANLALATQTLRAGHDRALREQMLAQIEAQVQTLSQLSQEMIDLSQIESGQVMLRLVPTEVEPLAQWSVANLLPQAAAKGLQLNVDVPPSLMALADEQQVARVIGNLVHNAVKFTPKGGVICIHAEATGDDVQISVSDTGPGIPAAEQTRIFERFYKADRARSKGGTGLGLAIARHIVEGHGGRIGVESRPGEGARFHFTLPKA